MSLEKRTLINNSPAELTETITATRTITNTVSYGFKQSLKLFAKTELEAGIPLLVSGKVELGMEFGFEANQQITNQKSETYTINRQVKVPPRTKVEAHGYINWVDNMQVPFTATARITGLADCLKLSGQVQYNYVNADIIKSFLELNGFNQRIIRVEADSVLAEVSGIFQGSYGLDTVFSVNEIK